MLSDCASDHFKRLIVVPMFTTIEAMMCEKRNEAMIKTALLTTALGLAIVAGPAAATAQSYGQQRPVQSYSGHKIPPGYTVVRRYGTRGLIVTRNNRLYFAQGSAVSYLNPRYSISEQIRQFDTRRRLFRD